MTAGTSTATAVFVAYGVPALDTNWIPPDQPVIVVHNDDVLLAEATHPNTRHIAGHGNVGFGAAVNIALPYVETDRIILINPDIAARTEHWEALALASSDEVVAVPLIQRNGRPTIVISPYPTPLRLIASTLGLGRLLARGTRVRAFLDRRADVSAGRRTPITEMWASAALLSLPTTAVRAIGGFDEKFFLYFEDVDLCRRLAKQDVSLMVALRDTAPAVHTVGRSKERTRVFRRSALLYAERQNGIHWRATTLLLRLLA